MLELPEHFFVYFLRIQELLRHESRKTIPGGIELNLVNGLKLLYQLRDEAKLWKKGFDRTAYFSKFKISKQ